MNRQRNILCFTSTILWGMLAHAYAFFNNNLSHDVLNAFVTTSIEEALKIEAGRFFVPLYRLLFRGPVVLPWLIGILGLLWTALAVLLVVKIFEIKSKCMIIATAGIMVTNISYIAQIATYSHEFDCNALSILLSIVAVYIWRRGAEWKNIIIGSGCLFFSIGLYQANVSVTLTLMVCVSIMDLFNEKDIHEVVTTGLKGIVMTFLSGILYAICTKIVFSITGLTPLARTDIFNYTGEDNIIVFYLKLIIPAMLNLGNQIAHPAYPQLLLIICILILLIVLAAFAVIVCKKKQFSFARICWIIVLIVSLPFAIQSVFFLARGEAVHDLMAYAVCFFYVIILMFASWIDENSVVSPQCGRYAKVGCYVLVFFIIWQNIFLANTAYIKKEIEAKATFSTMTRVVGMMEAQEEYIVGQTTIAFIGRAQVYDEIAAFDKVNEITGLWSNHAIPGDASLEHYNVYKAYFDYVLNYPIVFCDDKTHEELKVNEEVWDMPMFPEEGCMKMIGDVFVIRMGY